MRNGCYGEKFSQNLSEPERLALQWRPVIAEQAGTGWWLGLGLFQQRL